MAKYPAQTIWRKGATATRSWKKVTQKDKRTGAKKQVVSAKKPVLKAVMKAKKVDKRKRANWVWCAVECGQFQGVCKTHEAGTKRAIFALLPKPLMAEDRKPRGHKEIVKHFKKHVRPGSFVVADGWLSTDSAIRELGYRKPARPVNHSRWFRDPVTGHHTNDAESEVNRIKSWMRKKYGRLQTRASPDDEPDQILTDHLNEFMVLKNVGSGMSTVMRAFAFQNGQTYRARDI